MSDITSTAAVRKPLNIISTLIQMEEGAVSSSNQQEAFGAESRDYLKTGFVCVVFERSTAMSPARRHKQGEQTETSTVHSHHHEGLTSFNIRKSMKLCAFRFHCEFRPVIAHRGICDMCAETTQLCNVTHRKHPCEIKVLT